MALEHAILVSLTERSGSGYELAKRFDKSIGFFWGATHQQIYRVLKRMDEAGWVMWEHVTQDDRPDKKVYSVSGDGRVELERWLADSVPPVQLRDELAVKLRGASLGDTAAIIAEVARHRDHHAERLDVYLAIEKHDFPAPGRLTGRRLHQYLVLRGGIRAESGLVDWCDEVVDAMRRDHPTTEGSAPR